MAKPVLTTISAMSPVAVLSGDAMIEIEDATYGTKRSTISAVINLALDAAKTIHYTKTLADARFKAIDAKEGWDDITDKPQFLAAGATAEAARAAISAGTSSLVIGTEAGTAADAKDSRIVNAIQASEKGSANGVAPLDGNALIPPEYLPSYVDDVIEVATFTALPVTGELGKIYITLDTSIQYRYSGTAYVQITLGEVTSVNGRKGVVSGLAEKADVDSGLAARYTKSESDDRFLTKSAYGEQDPFYNKDASDARFRQLVTGNSKVYTTTDAGVQASIEYSAEANPNSIAQRDADGELIATAATKAQSAVTLGQLTAFSNAVNQELNNRYTKEESLSASEVNSLFSNLGNTIIGYSLPIVATNGEVDLNSGNIFLLNDIANRAVSFINEPVSRSILIIIKIIGDKPVLWPSEIDWVLGSTPILGTGYTVVNIFKHGDNYVGQHSISVNKTIE